VGPIADGESATFTVHVTVPADAEWYITDAVAVTATSVDNPTEYSASATLTTQAYAPPLISVWPEALASTQYVNEVTTVPLTIGNGNGVPLTFNAATSPPGAALLMHLDEPAGATTFYDASGNNNHGSCSDASCPVAGVEGRFGKALSFDGMDDDVQVPDSLSLRPSPFTIAAWFQWNRLGTDDIGFITAKGYENYELHTGGFSGTNGVRFIPAGAGSAVDAPTSSTPAGTTSSLCIPDLRPSSTLTAIRSPQEVGSSVPTTCLRTARHSILEEEEMALTSSTV